MIERWTIPEGNAGRAEWLARRKPNINGSEVAALFGCNPFQTPLSLYAHKAGLVELPPPSSDVLDRGHILEPAVAKWVKMKERPDWKIAEATEYVWSPVTRLGCTPDFHVHCPVKGMGVMQTKTMSMEKFEEGWSNGPPQYVVLQTLQEMMLENVAWGAIAALILEFPHRVSGRLYEFERHAMAEKRIIVSAAQFWSDVDARRQPKFNFARDDDVIKAMFPQDNGATIDMTGDNRMPALLDERESLKAIEKHAAGKLKAIEAEIAAKMGDATSAIVKGWDSVTRKTQKREGHTVKPTSFRVLRASRAEAKAEEIAA